MGHEDDPSTSPDEEEDVNDNMGQLSMDESGQVRYLGKSSGFYLLQNSRTYQNGAFHFSGYGHSKSPSLSNLGPLDPLELPPKDLSIHLIQLYFKRFYPVLPLFYKKRLVSSIDSPMETVSPLLLNAIYAVASRVSPDVRVRSDEASADTAGDIYFERAKHLLDDYYDVPRISTVQALLLLASHQHGAMKSARAWLYSGMVTDWGYIYISIYISVCLPSRKFFCVCRHFEWHRILAFTATATTGILLPRNASAGSVYFGAVLSWIAY